MTTTASIYFNKIKVDYPQAGKDNDSQGFRDNFRNIFNAFSATNADLEHLQLNSVSLGGSNDFGYNTIKKASLQSSVTKISDYTASAVNGNVYVNFLETNYQKYLLSPGQTTFFIENWPSTDANGNAVMSKVEIAVKPASTTTTVISFGGNLKTVGNQTHPFSLNTASTHFFEIWTDDAGTTIYAYHKGS